jgi:RHS repeat-associated protein
VTKTIDGVTYTTGYGYDPTGRIIQMTYPNGLVVNFERDTVGDIRRITTDRNGVVAILAENITHLPFGPLKTMTLGNGLMVNRSFDQLYRMTENSATGILDQQYSRDPVGNVTAIMDRLDPIVNLSFGYNDLYRLIAADGAVFGDIGFDYDASGNRQSRISDGLAETYQYTDGANRLALITNTEMTDVVTDAAGNIIQYGNRDLSYSPTNRLSVVEEEGVVLGSYVYNAVGRRIKKIAAGQTTIFHYDLSGRLIAESDGQGIFSKVYIYLEDEPLAMIAKVFKKNGKTKDKQKDKKEKKQKKKKKNKKASEQTFYYHNDHLGTPQRMTDANGNIVWAADYKPFGRVTITVETIENNLRFSGQYKDAETGLHYNTHRYYDPAIGRYLTSDPIGLEGGINPYAYVANNPVILIDPYGLWSPKIHNRIILAAFPNLPSNLRQAIERGSEYADSSRFQSPEYSYMHAMRGKGQSAEDACKKMQDYINAHMEMYIALLASGQSEAAYFALGMALHPVMDSTSPSHSGFQKWDGLWGTPGYKFITHWNAEREINNSQIQHAVNLIYDALR